MLLKECEDCEFFNGYDYSDGTPKCDYTDGDKCGYEYCPYNDYRNCIKDGISIKIDAGFMSEYIYHTLKNSIDGECHLVATNKIKEIVTDELKEHIIGETKQQVKAIVNDEIANFMSKEIIIGGGWREPERKLTRTEYLSEIIEEELKDKFKSDVIKSSVSESVKSAINTYERQLRDEINAGIKTYFDTATRQILTENIVSMLMCNDTYKKLSESMQTFLPQKSE